MSFGRASSVGEVKPKSSCSRSQIWPGSFHTKKWLFSTAAGRVRRICFLVLKDTYTVLQEELGEV